MWNIKTLALTVQKLLARLKFQRGGQNDKMTDRTNTICPLDLRSRGHKNCCYISCLVYVKVFWTAQKN